MVIYSSNNCEYCTKLKDMLDAGGIEYTNKDVDTPEGHNEFYFVTKISGNTNIPTIVVPSQGKKQILSPKVSFNSIKECYETILKLIQ